MKKIPLTAIFIGCLSFAYSQIFTLREYRAADGLETDIIKAVAQDSYGFIWIGTDDGLLSYNGITFRKHPEAASSDYFKDFLKTSDNRLLAIHDLGLIEIKGNPDTAQFVTILNGAQVKSPEALWYPKHAYEDQVGSLWISEPQSVVKFQDGTWKRFDFGPEDNSSSFVRSFSFAQIDDDRILVSSFQGNFFLYSYANDAITSLNSPRQSLIVNTIRRFGNRILVGTGEGVLELKLAGKRVELTDVGAIGQINDLIEIGESRILACSENGPSSIINYGPDGSSVLKLENLNASINQVYKDSDNNLWLSTLRGIQLIRKPQFRTLELGIPRTFVEGIIWDDSGKGIYSLSKEHIFFIDKETEKVEQVIYQYGGYFLTGLVRQGELWVSNEFSLLRVENDTLISELDLSSRGRYIFDIYLDSNENIWLSQEATLGVINYDPIQGSIWEYGPEKGLDLGVVAIEGNEDFVLAATGDPKNYLFKKNHDESKFENISHTIEINREENFSIEDMEIIGDEVYLATTHGLFLHTADTVIRVDLESSIRELGVKVIKHQDEYLWLGNSLGIFRYHIPSGQCSQFNEKTGMPINYVNEEGLYLDDEKVWVGTSYGLAVMNNYSDDYMKTPAPVIMEVSSNGNDVFTYDDYEIEFEFNSFQRFTFSSLSYPADEVQYSYKILELDEEWSNPSFSRNAELSNVPPGSYHFRVRAKKLGEYVWSDFTEQHFSVKQSFYSSIYFFLILLTGVVAIAVITRTITKRFARQREIRLKEMVDDRTRELNRYKDNLEELVRKRTRQLEETQSQLIQSEKMASLGTLTAGVAHEINNPTNYLQAGLYSLNELVKNHEEVRNGNLKTVIQEVSKNMQLGVDRITNIVSSLSHFSRKNQNGLRVPCNLHDILDNCLRILSHETKDRIEVDLDYDPEIPAVFGDEGNLHQLFINILSNAIHAVPEEGGKILLQTSKGKNDSEVIVRITDNGIGIKKQHMKQLFDPFFTTKPPGVGTGLGLYISHKIVDDHEGSINFDSTKGKGTTVEVKFG